MPGQISTPSALLPHPPLPPHHFHPTTVYLTLHSRNNDDPRCTLTPPLPPSLPPSSSVWSPACPTILPYPAQVGGHIQNYLLEKSRITIQQDGERNFHVFYQLLASATDARLGELKLMRGSAAYTYLSAGNTFKVDRIDDKRDFMGVCEAFRDIGFTKDTQDSLWGVLAAVLHLGNVTFKATGTDSCGVADRNDVQNAAACLHTTFEAVAKALTSRTIATRGQVVTKDLRKPEADTTRDAFARALYNRTFTHVVGLINAGLDAAKTNKEGTVIGVLDIYGFEIFERNRCGAC